MQSGGNDDYPVFNLHVAEGRTGCFDGVVQCKNTLTGGASDEMLNSLEEQFYNMRTAAIAKLQRRQDGIDVRFFFPRACPPSPAPLPQGM